MKIIFFSVIGEIVLVHVIPIFLTDIFKGIVSDSNQISGGRIIDVTLSKFISSGEEPCTQTSINLGTFGSMIVEVGKALSPLSRYKEFKIIINFEKWYIEMV